MSLRNWIGMFLMGTINNLPYVIVNSAASTIAESFNEKNLVAVVFGANVALSFFVKGLNTLVLLKVSYKARYIVNGCVMLVGLFGIAYAFNFGFAIACIALVGSTSAFGENVTLGFLLGFPSSLVNAWSSGTGMAGLLGSALYVLFGCVVGNGNGQTEKLHSLTKNAFLLTTPVVIVYWLAYFVLIKRPANESELQVDAPVPVVVNDFSNNDESSESLSDDSRSQTEPGDGKIFRVQESIFRKVVRCLQLVLWLSINLAAVYMFEYVAQACASKVRPNREYNVGCPELYASIQLCYQAGVFVSRSSMQLFTIRRVEVLSVLQFFNMLLWILDMHYKFLPVASLPGLMVFVGLLGGASYVNIFYLILHDNRFQDKDRELCVNLAGLVVTLGIVMGSGLQTALSVTVMKDD